MAENIENVAPMPIQQEAPPQQQPPRYACVEALGTAMPKDAIMTLLRLLELNTMPTYAQCLAARALFDLPSADFLAFAQQYAAEQCALPNTSFAGTPSKIRLPNSFHVIRSMEFFSAMVNSDKPAVGGTNVMVLPAQTKTNGDYLAYSIAVRVRRFFVRHLPWMVVSDQL